MTIGLLLLGIVCVVGQMLLPLVPLLGVKPILVTLPVAYAVVRLGWEQGLLVALGIGLTLDLLSGNRLGVTVVALGAMVAFLWSQQENFKFDFWLHSLVLTWLGSFLYLIVDYAAYCWQVGQWRAPFYVWWTLAAQGLFVLVVTLPVFACCDLLLAWLRGPKLAARGSSLLFGK